MNALLAQFHFLRPWWLLLLLLWPPLLWWLTRTSGTRGALTRLVDASLLPHLLERHGRRQRWPLVLPPVAALLATLALAGPTWQRLPQPLFGNNASQVVALSLSRRMLAHDVTPDRLTRARYKVHELLASNADGQNGLIAYTGAAFVVAPLTTDVHALGNLLDSLAPDVMPVNGDAPAKAIARGVKLLQQGGAGIGSLVLVTDTADTAAVSAARDALAAGVRVSVLGVGRARGAPVTLPDGAFLKGPNGAIVMARRDDASLRAVAAAGGGRYVVMTPDHADIKALADELRPGQAGGVLTVARSDRWRDFGSWLLLPLLPLAALVFRRGWLLALCLVMLPPWPLSVRASGLLPASVRSVVTPVPSKPNVASGGIDRLSWWWLNADQRATRALTDGDPRRAQQLARSPSLRGAAAYRAGDYSAAVKAFSAASGSDAAYNRGNALAREGHFQDAIKAYTQALKVNPHNADAAANRKAVEDWLHKQKKQPLNGRRNRRGQNSQEGQNQPHGPSDQDRRQPQQSSRNAARSSPQKSSGGQQSQPPPDTSKPANASSSPPPASPASAPQSASSPPAVGQRAQSEKSPDTAAARRQQSEAASAGRALKSQMDRELGKRTSQPRPYVLGDTPASGSSAPELPQSMSQALQRVPDDPGGLLRRKFELEYRQRNGDGRGDSQ